MNHDDMQHRHEQISVLAVLVLALVALALVALCVVGLVNRHNVRVDTPVETPVSREDRGQ